MNTLVYVVLLLFHWVGDFVWQSRYIADNKSKNWVILALHVTIYMAAMTVGFLVANQIGPYNGLSLLWWVLVNFALHFATDAITSRLTGYCWKTGRVKAFFTTIGFDQFLHGAALLLTTRYIMGI